MWDAGLKRVYSALPKRWGITSLGQVLAKSLSWARETGCLELFFNKPAHLNRCNLYPGTWSDSALAALKMASWRRLVGRVADVPPNQLHEDNQEYDF